MHKFQLYKASAGSGKTYKLTRQYLLILFREVNNYKRILAVTFTNKAAGELKERIIAELAAIASGQTEKSKHFQYLENELNKEPELLIRRAGTILVQILQDYSHFSVGTIDEFFQTVLRAFTREIGIYTGYEVVLNADKVINEAIARLLLRIDDNHDLREWLISGITEQIADGKSWAKFQKDLLAIGKELTKEQLSKYFFGKSVSGFSNKDIRLYSNQLLKVKKEYEDQLREIAEKAQQIIDRLGLTVDDFTSKNRGPAGYLTRLSRGSCDPRSRRKALDGRESWVTKASNADQRQRVFQAVESGLDDLLVRAIDLWDHGYKDYITAVVIREKLFALGLARSLAAEIVAVGQENNTFLLALTNPLIASVIADNPSPFIYERTGSFFNHYMIDEFQDTSDLQWNNFRPLISDSMASGGSGLVVGDVKQSIYRWRNSNWQLMASKAEQDLASVGTEKHTLGKNFRSRQSVIDFNNLFFSSASDNLISYLNGKEDLALTSDDHNLVNIAEVYSDVKQDYGKSPRGGYVRVVITAGDKPDAYPVHYPQLAALVKTLVRDKGYQPKDIVFLERRKSECASLVRFFNQYTDDTEQDGYTLPEAVSPDSFMLGASPELRCIMLCMALINKPSDTYLLGKLALEYVRLKKQNLQVVDYDMIAGLKAKPGLINDILGADLDTFITDHAEHSIIDIYEDLISLLDLAADQSSTAFLIGFKEALKSNFSPAGMLTIDKLVQWWEEEGYKTVLPMSEEVNALRVMTIHSAKGLEFPVVIMANCDWKLDHISIKSPTLWVSTEHTPYDHLPLVPVGYKNDQLKSYFRSDYIVEKMQIHLDNLNLLYVAFTRAIDQLHVFVPGKYINANGRIASLINSVVEIPEEGIYSFGDEDTRKAINSEAQKNNTVLLPGYLQRSGKSTLTIRQEIENKAITRGLALHAILAKIDYANQLPGIIADLKEKGELSEEESIMISNSISVLINNEKLKPYYTEGKKILKEPTIISPEHNEIRPDRVVISGNEATVIEYKTGNKSLRHSQQVKSYMEALVRMGYRSGLALLVYLDLNLIEEVN